MNRCHICGSGFALDEQGEEYCPVCSSPASMGDALRIEPKAQAMKDYGCDPLGNDTFRMVPSGDVVSREERDKRLKKERYASNEILGMSWDALEKRQGGKLKRD